MAKPTASQWAGQGPTKDQAKDSLSLSFPLFFFFLLRGPPKPKNPKREAGGGEIGALAAVLALLAAILALPAMILALLASDPGAPGNDPRYDS